MRGPGVAFAARVAAIAIKSVNMRKNVGLIKCQNFNCTKIIHLTDMIRQMAYVYFGYRM